MDLVTCPFCQFVFSPTPGQRVKCPACMKMVNATGGAPPRKPPADKPPVRAARVPDEEAHDESSGAPSLAFVLPVVLLVGAVVGVGMWMFLRPRPGASDGPPAIAQNKP